MIDDTDTKMFSQIIEGGDSCENKDMEFAYYSAHFIFSMWMYKRNKTRRYDL